MCEALIRENVEVIFGIPGGAIMPFYHALWEYHDKLHHVLCRHEQGAGHAAEGYARASGKVGVCVATSGPGATNLVTPIADAWMDSTPLVAVTGQVSTAVLGKDAFQEIDITGITMPITKHNYLVKRIEDIPIAFKEAFHLARSGRPGPVLVDVCKDAQQARCEPDWNVAIDLPTHRPRFEVHADPLKEALDLLATATKPLIIAGNGVIIAGASGQLLEFAERTGFPVITTLHGIGSFPREHPLFLGMPGMHGWVHVNRALQECDLLINIGSRFDDRVTGKAATFVPHAKVIHIDIDPCEIGKNVKTHVPIVGDARHVLQQLLAGLPANGKPPTEWIEHIREMKELHQPKQQYVKRPDTDALMPHEVYAAFNQAFQGRDHFLVVTDVGQHQMWAAQLLDLHKPRTHLTSGGSGTMGFSVPAALGAAFARPDDTIWVICGDGGFQMTNQELATIMQEGVKNVKIAVINNGYLGMVRQWQQLFENKVYSHTTLSGPDFARLAEAYGLRGLTVTEQGDVSPAIEEAWDHDGPVLIDFQVEREQNVFPIVPQGKSIGEMMTEAP